MAVGKHITMRAAVIGRRFALKPGAAALVDALLDAPASKNELATMLVERAISANLTNAGRSIAVHAAHARAAVENVAELGALSGGHWARNIIKFTPKLRASAKYAFTDEGRALVLSALDRPPTPAAAGLAMH